MTARRAELEKCISVVTTMDRRLNSSLDQIGFLKGTYGNDRVGEVISHSMTGNSLDVATKAVVSEVVLFVARSWENNANSITRLEKAIGDLVSEIESERRERLPDWSDELLEIGNLSPRISMFKKTNNEFRNSQVYKAIEIYRHENLAHLLPDQSSASRHFRKVGQNAPSLTVNELIEAAEFTAKTVCDLMQIFLFSVKNPAEWIDHSEETTKELWRVLPKLSEVEGQIDGVAAPLPTRGVAIQRQFHSIYGG